MPPLASVIAGHVWLSDLYLHWIHTVFLFQRPQTLNLGPSPLPYDLLPTNGLTVTLIDFGEHYSGDTEVSKMGDSSQPWQWRSHVKHTAIFLSLRAFCL